MYNICNIKASNAASRVGTNASSPKNRPVGLRVGNFVVMRLYSNAYFSRQKNYDYVHHCMPLFTESTIKLEKGTLDITKPSTFLLSAK